MPPPLWPSPLPPQSRRLTPPPPRPPGRACVERFVTCLWPAPGKALHAQG